MSGQSISLLGLGIMGRGMAINLLKKGYEVHAWNRTQSKLSELQNSYPNLKTYETIRDATNGTHLTIICLTTDDTVENVFNQIQNTKYILDTGTTSLELTEKMRKISEKNGIRFFDCPMTGSKSAAENGEIVFMFGGTEEEAEEIKYFLNTCGKVTIYCKQVGNGQKVKIALNMVQAGVYTVLLEGLRLSEKLGISDEIYYQVIDNSAVQSGITKNKLRKAIDKDYSTNFALKNMYKDILHADHLMEKYNIQLSLCKNLKTIFKKAMDIGFGDEDFLSIEKVIDTF